MVLTPKFVDPRDVKPLELGRAALELLVEAGLKPSPRSVLSALLESGESTDTAARIAARKALEGRGLLLDASARPGPEAALLQRSLEVLAAPEAEVRLESRKPGAQDAEEEDRSYFLAGDGVAPVTYLDDGLQVHAALRADAFAAQLSKLFQPSAAPGDFAPLALMRSQVEAARLAWGLGTAASQSVPRAQAIENVKRFAPEGGDAAGLLDVLVETEVLVEANGTLSLTPAARYALAAIWSGESHELMVRDLADDASPDEPEGVGLASLYVAGPAGQRVIVDLSEVPLDGSEGAPPEGSDAATDPDEALDSELLQFTWLTRDELNQSLEALLGLSAP